MLVPVRWLRDYVDVPADVRQLAHALTMSGTKIEAVHGAAPDFEGVFVGKVLAAGPHPAADRLSVCRVDVGGEELHIVCGAPNVRAGLTVAVAKVGARLPGGLKIRKSKIRGEPSEGMICSARELGLGEDAGGILELDAALENGADFAALAAAAGDAVLEAEITPNRPDCLALLGIAREVAALYGGAVRLPAVWSPPGRLAPAAVPVDIESPRDCRRYIGRVVRGVRIGPSPDWLQARLRAMGSSSINNVVDITNFVLFETGQPLHAFDLDRLRGGRIRVRRARAGEPLTTLDGIDRTLDPGVLVIADAERAVALAGIMGGAETAVSADTRDLLLESAWFEPGLVRSGRRKLGLDTDASYRFERGADLEAARWAADRATQLLIDIAGGSVREAECDAYPAPHEPARVSLRVDRCNLVVGTQLGGEDMATLLRRIELPATLHGGLIEVQVPSFRRDLGAEIDLVEEVARVHGYERIASTTLPPAALAHRANVHETLLGRLRDLAVGLGYFEVRTSAFMDRRDPDRLGLATDDPRRRFVRVANPIVTHLDTMRTTLLPGMLRVLRHNRNHDQEQLRFAQLDRVFLDVPGPHSGLPSEPERLVLLASGSAEPPAWDRKPRPFDLYDLKGDAEALFADLGVDTRWAYGYTEAFCSESVSFEIAGTYGTIGRGGEVRGEVLQAFDLEPPVHVLEIDVEALERHLPGTRRYREMPRFPAVKRDLSLVVPAEVSYGAVHAAVRAAAGPNLESLQCFDVYRGDADTARSVGLRLRFRATARTLSDADVTPVIEAIVRELERSLGVRLRAGS